MSIQFRPTVPADAAAVSQLMQQVFGMPPDHPNLGAAQMQWKYWSQHPNWAGSRGYVMEREGEIISHGAVVPLSLAWGDRRLKIVHLIDWAAQPDSAGAGVAFVKRLGQLADGIFSAGGSDTTLKLLPALGFRDSGNATTFALPLRPLARLRADSSRSWKSAARCARNLIWMMRSPGGAPPGWNARRLSAADLATARFPTPRGGARAALFERSVPSVTGLLECPAAPAEFYLVERDGSPCGYFVLTQAVAQSRIAEAWVEPGEVGDWRALYLLAVAQAAAHPHIAEIAAVASMDPELQALPQAGFRSRGQFPLRFWIHGGDVPDAVRYQLADGDGAYLHDGRANFWA